MSGAYGYAGLPAIPSGETLLCTKVQITADWRMFLFFNHYDPTFAANANRWQTINEIVITGTSPSFVYTLRTQKLNTYQSGYEGVAFNKIYTDSTGQYFFLHSVSGYTLNTAKTSTFNTGFLMRENIEAKTSANLVASSNCITTMPPTS